MAETGSTPAAGAGTDEQPAAAGAGTASAPQPVQPQSVGLGEPQGLLSELEAAARDLPAEGGSPGEPVAAASDSGSWGELAPGLVAIGCGIVLPQWQITADEQTHFSAAAADCLEQLFPGGLGGKYACWIRLITAGCAITIARATQPGGLPPLFNRPRRPKLDKPAGQPAQSETKPLSLMD